jgi:hypothetical protein
MTIKKQPQSPDFGHMTVDQQKAYSRQQWENSSSAQPATNEKLPQEGKKKLDIFRSLQIT